jgi:hypothetical protein
MEYSLSLSLGGGTLNMEVHFPETYTFADIFIPIRPESREIISKVLEMLFDHYNIPDCFGNFMIFDTKLECSCECHYFKRCHDIAMKWIE